MGVWCLTESEEAVSQTPGPLQSPVLIEAIRTLQGVAVDPWDEESLILADYLTYASELQLTKSPELTGDSAIRGASRTTEFVVLERHPDLNKEVLSDTASVFAKTLAAPPRVWDWLQDLLRPSYTESSEEDEDLTCMHRMAFGSSLGPSK